MWSRALATTLGLPVIALCAATLAMMAAPATQSSTYTFRRIAGSQSGTTAGYVDGPAPHARFSSPSHVLWTPDGTIYVNDGGGARTRAISPTGTVSTVTSVVSGPMALDELGRLLVAYERGVYRVSPTTNPERIVGGTSGFLDGAAASARFASIRALVMDPEGDLYLTDAGPFSCGGSFFVFTPPMGHLLRRLSQGEVSTVAGGVCGNLTRDGTGADARFSTPGPMVLDAAGVLYVADTGTGTIRRVTRGGVVTTLAGRPETAAGAPGQLGVVDGVGVDAKFYAIAGMALGADGLYVIEGITPAALRRVGFDGRVTTIASVPSVTSIAQGPDGDFIVSWGNAIARMTPTGHLTAIAGLAPDASVGPGFTDGPRDVAQFDGLRGVALDSRGGAYLGDSRNNSIRYLSSSGMVTTVAGSRTAGGANGTGTQAQFYGPAELGVGPDGTVYVTEEVASRVRAIAPDGVVTTLAGTYRRPIHARTDRAGNVYVCDLSAALQRVSLAGAVSVFHNGLCRTVWPEPQGTVAIIAVDFDQRGYRLHPSGAIDALSVAPRAMDPLGRLYAFVASTVIRLDPDGTQHQFPMVSEGLSGGLNLTANGLSGVDVNEDGDIYYASGAQVWIGTRGPLTAPSVSGVETTAVWPGAQARLVAAVTGTPRPGMQWQRSTDGGATWADLPEGDVITGTRGPTLTFASASRALAAHQYRLVATNLSGAATSTAAALRLEGLQAAPQALSFAAMRATATGPLTASPAPQQLILTTTGTGRVSWTAQSDRPWVVVTPAAGIGSRVVNVSVTDPGGASAHANLTISATRDGIVEAQTIPVTFVARVANASTGAPVGTVDTPASSGPAIGGSLAVTGWAVDDVGVREVLVWRSCVETIDRPRGACQSPVPGAPEGVLLGVATRLSGARPDVEAAYRGWPDAQRAGWGLLVLTNLLPDIGRGRPFGGQGTFGLHVYATDVEGQTTLLGSRTIVIDNDGAVRPFGAIDAPTQGGTVSGVIPTFGWVLTPDSGTGVVIPPSGNTVQVFVDGALAGTVTYNHCRGTVGTPPPTGVLCDDDVATAFRGDGTRYRNLDAGRGAIGVHVLDTTTLADGQHTIVWVVTDSAGRSENVGSRYFFVSNGAARTSVPDPPAARPQGMVTALQLRTGFDAQTPFSTRRPDRDGVVRVEIPLQGRVEIHAAGLREVVHEVDGEERQLPVGLGVDLRHGVVTWAPGPGFVGAYRLVLRATGRPDASVVITVRDQG